MKKPLIITVIQKFKNPYFFKDMKFDGSVEFSEEFHFAVALNHKTPQEMFKNVQQNLKQKGFFLSDNFDTTSFNDLSITKSFNEETVEHAILRDVECEVTEAFEGIGGISIPKDKMKEFSASGLIQQRIKAARAYEDVLNYLQKNSNSTPAKP